MNFVSCVVTVRSTDGCSGGSFVNPRLLYFVHLFGHSYSGRVQCVFSILLFDFNCHRRISGVHLSIDIAFGDVVNPGMIDCCIRDPNRILSSSCHSLRRGSRPYRVGRCVVWIRWRGFRPSTIRTHGTGGGKFSFIASFCCHSTENIGA